MYLQIQNLLLDYLGYYISNKSKELAISQSFAIDTDVYGLEVVVSESNSINTSYTGKARTSEYQTTVTLTQHEGKDNIRQAVEILKDYPGWDTRVRWVLTGGKQYNVRRCIIDISNTCVC